jgi:regulatory protein
MPRKVFDDDDEFEQFDSEPFESSKASPTDSNAAAEHETVRTSRQYANQSTSKTAKWVNLTPDELRQRTRARAVYFLSRREYSRSELRARLIVSLRETPVTTEMIDEALDFMAKNRWQSDERFVQQTVKVKGAKFGLSRVKHELNQHHLPAEIVAEQLDSLAQTEVSRAREVWQRKFGQPPVDMKERAKQVRFMASRGFSFDVIKKAMSGIDDGLDEDMFSGTQ